MNVKKWLVSLLTIISLLIATVCPVIASDIEENPSYRYELTVDDKDTVEVTTGDVITVTLHLYRTDKDDEYTIYAMQDEIRYDGDFFRLVENSALMSEGIQSTDISVMGGLREFYMNFVSFSGNTKWASKERIGSFQLEVIGTEGVSTITNEDFLVSKSDGNGSYKCEANELTVILTSDCTVKFETNGGTPIEPIAAIYGETISRPKDPVREGKYLVGWYKDIHLTQEWDFENDTVTGNMTLYAKWEDGKAPVGFGKGDSFNMDWLEKVPIVPIAITLVVLLILFLLIRFLLVFFADRKYVKYSLFNGDVALDYRNDYRNAHVSVVLNKENISYTLGEIDTTANEKYLRYIENNGKIANMQVEPGIYDGKLVVKDDIGILTSKCKIKVVDKELKQKK